ncbi:MULTISPECIES: MGDG synthase family glycosyltransferase [Bacillaceae]|uniref:Diacylglycerol glucosyltransferase N-terminal domain-containing protein n=1 Tax=Evansella alkalicola TaxID=745819 RepID=A0ABS6JQI3_9BACI|nr:MULTISPECIES: hypothetical protein [Bacillaceae]MBU9720532.1 hypothetical protein [Bacillus alkalicola]
MERIAIFTISIGEGHHQVSIALKEEWERLGYQPTIIDIMSFMEKKTSSGIKKTYYKCIHTLPYIWDLTYRLTDNRVSSYALQPLLALWWKELFEHCKAERYDVMIGTHPLATQLCLYMKKKVLREQNHLKIFSVLTDFNTHSLSISPNLDGTFVAQEKEMDGLKRKYPNCQFFAYGIPTREIWDKRKNDNAQDITRKELSIPDNKPFIVISGGGEGLIREKEVLTLLEKDRLPSFIIWFQGKACQERKRLRLKNGSVVHLLPFSSNYHEYVKSADFFISKPGGVSMAEAILWNIPTGILSPLPGQEKINQAVLKNRDNITVLHKGIKISEIIRGQKEKLQHDSDIFPARKRVVSAMLECCQHSNKTYPKNGSITKQRYPLIKKEWNT